MPKIPDSSPNKWIYSEHTRVKHEILQKYLSGWLKILGRYHQRLIYFDGFAGRGQYERGEPGSPLIAMNIASKIIEQQRVGEVVCVFIEKDTANFANLQKTLELYKPKNPKVKVAGPIHGDFAQVVGQILEEVGAKLAPSFFFIDPFGFSGVPFSLIRDILAIPRTEVFLTFMHRDIARFLVSPYVDATFDNLFGIREWRKVMGLRGEDREYALRELYMEQLRKDAGARYTWAFKVCADEKTQTLYYLIHAANNFKALYLMKGIMYNQGPGGVFAYLGPDDFHAKAQLPLFSDDLSAFRTWLVDRFKGRTLPYDQILEESYMETQYIDKNYREILKSLESEEKIVVTRTTSKTSKGLSGQDLIRFPS